jgi:hypothetical protein
MSIKLRSGGVWKNVNKAYLRSGGVWKNITKAYIRSGGVWKSMFGFISSINDPSIAQKVTLTTNSSSMPAILTGRNYRWTNATVLTYKFQYYNGSQWLDGNGSNATGTISNPSVGSSTPKLYTPVIGDFPSSSSTSTGQFRFVVTATNTNVTPSLQTISTSDTVSIQNVVSPIIPTISMDANTNVTQTSGTINWTSTNQASFSSTGTFSGTGTTETSISKSGLTATNPGTTYTGTVTVTSSTGNTASADYSLTTSPLVQAPTNQSPPVLSISSNNNMSVTSGAWTNSPTSYRYRWYQTDPRIVNPLREVTTTAITDSFSGSYLREYQVKVNAINSGGESTLAADSNYISLEPPVVQYTITWNANGGTVSPTSTTVNAGQSVTAPTPTRDGYTFSHWRNPASGDLYYIYYAGSVFTPTESFTLYAIWTAAVVVPTGGSVSLTGSSTPGSVITASTSGWSGSPTSYSVVIRTSLSPNAPTESSTIVANSIGGASECQYTITTYDAVSPPNIFKAFAVASNSAGTSAVVSSGTITATPAQSSPPASPPVVDPPTPPAGPPAGPPAAPPSNCYEPTFNCPSGTYWDCDRCIG